MKITSAEFTTSAVKSAHYPQDGLPEIALIGRSNVGKSSLINTLVNRKNLAHTSSAPGKTRTVNFYRINGQFNFVDLPGFGYASVAQKIKKDWGKMMEEYFATRECLVGALVILDPRRVDGDMEDDIFRWLTGMLLPFEVVFTKTDKLSRNEIAAKSASLKSHRHIHAPIMFSAVTGAGRIELWKKVGGFLEG